MSLERLKHDGWLQALVLIAAVSGGLWAASYRAAPAPEPEPAAAPAGRKRPLNGKEWIVDADRAAGFDFETLAEAVAAASAGDVIRLRRGLHRGSAVLDKALTVVGDGKSGETVLTGAGPFALSARGGATVTVENLSVSASKGADARAAEVRERATLRLVRGAYAAYEGLTTVAVDENAFLDSDGADFTSGLDTTVFVHGRAKLKGGRIVGGKTLVSVLGAGAYLEASGVAFESGEIGLATGDHAHAVLTNPRFARLKIEAVAFSDSELKLIDPEYDRAQPLCQARGGRAECGTPLKGP